MAPTLKLTGGNPANPVQVDLSRFIDLTDDSGTDPAAPSFTDKVFTRSLLKTGATLSLEQLVEKELVFELIVNATSSPALATLIEQINQACNSPSLIVTWQDDGLSQPTTFDGLTGQFDIAYSYRKAQRFWTRGRLRLFTQPLGRTAAPRLYAEASGVGPVLFVSPYASTGNLAIGASTRLGTAGFGGKPMGASGGIFYSGNPSLAGDAPALLQIGFSGQSQTDGDFALGQPPFMAVSLLPDAMYMPLVSAQQFSGLSNWTKINNKLAVASTYYSQAAGSVSGVNGPINFTPWFGDGTNGLQYLNVPDLWAGQHRLFAFARASRAGGALVTLPGAAVQYSTVASVATGDWGLYDLGTFTLYASQTPQQVSIQASAGASNAFIDVTALAMLPDNSTWFMNPNSIPAALDQDLAALMTIDDCLGEQFSAAFGGTTAPEPGQPGNNGPRLTPYSRGLVPQPDPKNGLPVIAILSARSASPNPLNGPMTAQVNVLERVRYVLP